MVKIICDICGAKGKLFKAIIEDVELTVCENCSKFGKVISVVKQETPYKKIKEKLKLEEDQEPEIVEIVVEDYAAKIKSKREALNLTQKQLAKKISLKESLVHNIESGNITPSISLAKKIGSFLKIRLIEEYEDKQEKMSKTKTEGFTIGDFIKIKK